MRSGYKLKPDVFDDDVPLREFFSQFEFIANANDWSDSVKTPWPSRRVCGIGRVPFGWNCGNRFGYIYGIEIKT